MEEKAQLKVAKKARKEEKKAKRKEPKKAKRKEERWTSDPEVGFKETFVFAVWKKTCLPWSCQERVSCPDATAEKVIAEMKV